MKVMLVVSFPCRFRRDVITDFQLAGSQGTFFSFKQLTPPELWPPEDTGLPELGVDEDIGLPGIK